MKKKKGEKMKKKKKEKKMKNENMFCVKLVEMLAMLADTLEFASYQHVIS